MVDKISCGCKREGCTSEMVLAYIDYDDQNFVEMLLYNNGMPNSIYLDCEKIREVIEQLQKFEIAMWDKILDHNL